MQSGRRRFLRAAGALAATGALPRLSWADAGAPAYLAAARIGVDAYAICGLGADGALRFQIALPGRGHAAAAHPSQPLAVAFARRPGRFGVVIDCALGLEVGRLEAPAGRHFYGHGAFDAAGARLFTSENAFDGGDGVVGVWSTADWRRIDEWPSGGVGPHELALDRAGGRLIVANGGVRTHPDSGRAKLNLAVMRPNLAAIDAESGALVAIVEPSAELRMNGLRHLALGADGAVAAAAQWEGDPAEAPPLMALWRVGERSLRFFAAADPFEQARLAGYAGSAAISADGRLAALTAPRGGRAHVYERASGGVVAALSITDVCGVARAAEGFLFSDGRGGLTLWSEAEGPRRLSKHADHA